MVLERSGKVNATRPNKRALAIMGLVVSIPGHPQRYLIDVSVRSPHARRYADAHKIAAMAAKAGAKEKNDT